MSIRRILSRILSLPLACLCLAPVPGQTADQADLRIAVDHAIRPLMARYDIAGMAVAVTVRGQTRFFNYGLASKQDARPVSEHTLFELGSVSKTFTATLACQAEGLGKLSFNDHPGRYLPALKGSAIDQATLLDLGAYAAGGLPLQVPDEVKNDAQMLAWLRAFKPEAAPGVVRRYSNVSLGLFGQVTALALHEDFSDAVQRQVFPALGLKQTWVHVPAAAMADYAWGYDKAGQPVRVHPDVFDAETYGVKTSAADMIRFVQANIDPHQFPAPTARALDCTHVGYFKVGEIVQGLGWEQLRGPLTLPRLLAANSDGMINASNPATRLTPPQPGAAGTLFDKTGSTRGFGAYVAFVPAQGIGIVMLANKNVPIPARIEAAYAILTALAAPGQAPGAAR
ncbi:MAG TPA: class C beta-lactamase [Telluria sp.]